MAQTTTPDVAMLQLPPDRKLFKVAKFFNISKEEIVEYLRAKGFTEVQAKPSYELSDEMLEALAGHFAREASAAQRVRSKLEQLEKHRAPAKKAQPSVEEKAEVAAPAVEPAPAEATAQPVVVETAAPSAVAIEEEHVVAQEAAQQPATVAEEAPTAELQPEAAPLLETPAIEEQFAEAVATPVAPEELLAASIPEQAEQPQSQAAAEATTVEETPAAEAESTSPLAAAESTTEDIATDEATEATKPRRRVSNVIITSQPDTPSTSWQLRGLTVLGKIELPVEEPRRGRRADKDRKKEKAQQPPKRDERSKQQKPTAPPRQQEQLPQEPRIPAVSIPLPETQRTKTTKKSIPVDDNAVRDKGKKKAKPLRELITEEEIERTIRQTLAGIEEEERIKSKIKKQKKQQREEREQRRLEQEQTERSILRITEFVTTGELANLLGVSPAEVISKCLSLGLMVSINQRLDRDTIQLIASDYGVTVEFLTDQEITLEEETLVDPPELLQPRPPIVTIMGHVDHGKTSLLDYIRNSNIVAGEAGGITQHIGAYKVVLPNGKSITFLDTPGHEAFTAMRARGAQVTDIVVLVVAADDNVMPQTVEAISHARAAGVPIVVAINKIDKDTANPDRIKQQLAEHGVLVEEWGGKYQCAEISAKKGTNVDVLLEKILLEAELLDLKANPNRPAIGTVIEAHVDKGRGNVATVLVQNGTLRVGDTFICGQYFGRVRAMYDERGNRVTEAPPSTPVQVTGFEGLPEAGDKLVVSADEDKLRQIAQQRQILRREQQLRQVRRISLDEISRRMQQGGVKELRLILKTDVSGSLEALTDALQKLSTDEVTVSIIHRAVGAITESDVMLAAASDAIIIGFQVQMPAAVRRIAEREKVDVRLYSIIYDAINEVKLALQGLLSPEVKEEVTGRAEVRQIFRISKVGTVAGCYVLSGVISRNDKVRILRDGFEIYRGTIASLKHLKEDVRQVRQGFECGLTVSGFSDFVEGDIIEAFQLKEVQRTLA